MTELTDRRRAWIGRGSSSAGAVAGAGAALLALAVAAWALRLWRADFSIPFRYSALDDTLFYLSLIKGIAAHGWFWTNHNLGAPAGQQLFDYPQSADNLNFLLVKVLVAISGSPAVTINLFYLLTYPLDALAAFWALRRLGVSRPASLAAAILFALLPYHFFRSDSHLFLSAYYSLPLAACLFVSVLAGQPLFARRAPPAARPLAWLSKRSAETVVICVVIASDGLYYAIFGLILLFAALLLALLTRRGRVAAPGAAVACGLVGAILAINLAPTFVYQARHGSDPQVSRSPHAGDDLALSVSYLVLPPINGRLAPLRMVTDHYSRNTPRLPYCEQCYSSIGLPGDAGLLWLAVVAAGSLLSAPWLPRRRPEYRYAAAGVGVCLAVGVTGGLASLLRVFVSADIRAWNRLSLLIAFFALLALGLLVDGLSASIRDPRWRAGALAVAGVLLALAAIDQTGTYPYGYWIPYSGDRSEYRSDAAFVTAIEARLPRAASVFQLPYVPFPEGYQPDSHPGQTLPFAPAVSLEYDQLRGYANSDDLSWSYGAMKGRPADWEAQLATKPLDLALAGAAAAGFQGAVVNLAGYPDAPDLPAQLQVVLGTPTLTSPDGQLAFFDLRPLARRLAATHAATQLTALRTAVLQPLRLTCAAGALTIDNPSRAARRAVLSASASGPVSIDTNPAVPRGGLIRIALTLPAGRTRLELNGPPGAELIAPAVIESAFAPFAQRGGPAVLTGVVGPPCAHVPA